MSNLDEVKDYLGVGINVFEWEYPYPPDKGRVVVVDESSLDEDPLHGLDYHKTYGSNFAEFTKKFALEVGLKGSYGGFSASVKSKFSTSSFHSTTKKYVRIVSTLSGVRLGIPTSMRRNLHREFQRAIENAIQDDRLMDVFQDYGTHVVVKEIVGGRAEYFCSSMETEDITESEFELAAEAAYKAVGGSVAGSTKLNSSEKARLKSVEGSERLTVWGGTPQAQFSLQKGDSGGWEKWVGTVSTNPVFLGCATDGLIPIWDFVDDPNLQQRMQSAYRQLAAEHFSVQVFSATSKASARPDAQVTVPDDYKLLSGGAQDIWNGYGNLLTASFPQSDNTWRALGKDHSESDHGCMTVYALAVHDPDDVWEVRRFEATGNRGSHPNAEVSTGKDYVMVGGGARVNWNGYGNLLTASYPKNPTTWAASSKDHGEPDPATITAFALGLRCKVDGVIVKTDIQGSSSPKVPHPIVEVSPAREFVMVGGGAKVNWTGKGNLLTASYPKYLTTWAASSKDHTESDPASITGYAIGIKVALKRP